MNKFTNLTEKDLNTLEICKNNLLNVKGLINNKENPNKRINLIDDFNTFYYLPEKKKGKNLLHTVLNTKTLSNNKFPNLKLEANTPFNTFNKHYGLLKKNPLTEILNTKEVTLLNLQKKGFNSFYKGILGLLPKDQVLKTVKNKINYSDILLKDKKYIIKDVKIKNTFVNIYFPNIRFNFSKTKKRRINLTETYFTFTNKKHEKIRKNTKAKAIKQRRN